MNIDELTADVEVFKTNTASRLKEIKRELSMIQLTCDRFFEKIEDKMDEDPTAEMDSKCDTIGMKIAMVDDTVTKTLDEIMEVERWMY